MQIGFLVAKDNALTAYLREIFTALGWKVCSVEGDFVRGIPDYHHIFDHLQRDFNMIVTTCKTFQPLNKKLALDTQIPVIFLVENSIYEYRMHLYKVTGIYDAVCNRHHDRKVNFGFLWDPLPLPNAIHLPIGFSRKLGLYDSTYQPKSNYIMIVHSRLQMYPAIVRHIKIIAEKFSEYSLVLCGLQNENLSLKQDNVLQINLVDEGEKMCSLIQQCKICIDLTKDSNTLNVLSLAAVKVGTPLVHLDSSGIGKLLYNEDYHTGFSCADFNELYKKVEECMELPVESLREKAKQQRLCTKNFEFEKRVTYFSEHLIL